MVNLIIKNAKWEWEWEWKLQQTFQNLKNFLSDANKFRLEQAHSHPCRCQTNYSKSDWIRNERLELWHIAVEHLMKSDGPKDGGVDRWANGRLTDRPKEGRTDGWSDKFVIRKNELSSSEG